MAEAAAQNQGAWIDPYPGFNFKLEIQGVTEGHFAECDGLGVKINVTTYREGGNSQVTHRIPGAIDYAGVTLRYGLTKSTELWEWLKKALDGTVERRNVSLIVLERDGRTEGARWNLINAWPSQWQGARLDAAGSELAIETITLVFETLERG